MLRRFLCQVTLLQCAFFVSDLGAQEKPDYVKAVLAAKGAIWTTDTNISAIEFLNE